MSALKVTDSNFKKEVEQSDIPVLVDCWAPWCGPCRQVGPIVDKIADRYNGKAKVVKLNVDENSKTAQRYNITSIPTLLIIKKGKVVDGLIGAQPEPKIVEKLNKWI